MTLKIDSYRYPLLTDESAIKEATLAVLDRVPFYQTVTHWGFDPTDVDATAAETALEALHHWSADPYRRPDGQTMEKLRAALQPVSGHAFEGVLAREDKEAEEQEAVKWRQVWEEVRHLPASERWQAAIDRASQCWAAEPPAPAPPAQVGKLLEYQIAAYLDWALYLALVGKPITPPTMKQMHSHLWDGGTSEPDFRAVNGLLEKLKDADHLKLRQRIEQGGISDAWAKNVSRRN